MQALVLHKSLNPCGGAERVCLVIIEVLKNLGFSVTLATFERTNWFQVFEMFPNIIKPDREVVISALNLKAFSIYVHTLNMLRLLNYGKNFDISVNSHGDVLLVPADIIYMHFPTFFLLPFTEDGVKYYKAIPWKVYYLPHKYIVKVLAKSMNNSIILTNSHFSAMMIKKFLNSKPLILYPPVNVEIFEVIGKFPEHRENIVVSIGRYSPEKRFEWILHVAREMPDINFIIIGSANNKYSISYYEKLMLMKRRMNLNNVELLRNLPFKAMLKILSKAKVYLHAMKMEHFGIAVVEAMAAGLVPVVHRSGGTYTDVIEFGRYGYAYETLEECVKAIRHALDNHLKWFPVVKRAARRFSRKRFIEGFTKIVEKVMSI